MSVVFVPERLRGKAEVNQETLQRVSGRRDPWGGGTGAPGTARAAPALPGLAAAFATPLSGGAGGGGSIVLCPVTDEAGMAVTLYDKEVAAP